MLTKFAASHAGVTLSSIEGQVHAFESCPADAATFRRLKDLLSSSFNVNVLVKTFEPASVPAVALEEPEPASSKRLKMLIDQLPDATEGLKDLIARSGLTHRIICINASNYIIKRLNKYSMSSHKDIKLILSIIFFNALLFAGIALSDEETQRFQQACEELVERRLAEIEDNARAASRNSHI